MSKNIKKITNSATLNDFLHHVKLYSQTHPKAIDLKRYALVLEAASELKKILPEKENEKNIKIEINDTFNLASISTVISDIVITDTEKFAKMISPADNFEIFTLKDGNMKLNISFQSVLKSIQKPWLTKRFTSFT